MRSRRCESKFGQSRNMHGRHLCHQRRKNGVPGGVQIQTECCRCLRRNSPTIPTGRPSRYGKDAPAKLRQHLKGLFAEYQANLNLITPAIVISGNLAFDYGCQELTLTPKNGGEARFIRKRFLELWAKQSDGQWRIILDIDNQDLPDVVDQG